MLYVSVCACVCARAHACLRVHLEDVSEEPHHILVVLSRNLSLEAVHLVHVNRFVVAAVEVEVQRVAALEGEEEEDHLDAAYEHAHVCMCVCVCVCVCARARARPRGRLDGRKVEDCFDAACTCVCARGGTAEGIPFCCAKHLSLSRISLTFERERV